MNPGLPRRRALRELLAVRNLAGLAEEPFLIPVPKEPAYTRAVRRLQQWQQREHATTVRTWLGQAGEDE